MQELSEWLKNNTGENLAGNIADAVARAKLDTLAEIQRLHPKRVRGHNLDNDWVRLSSSKQNAQVSYQSGKGVVIPVMFYSTYFARWEMTGAFGRIIKSGKMRKGQYGPTYISIHAPLRGRLYRLGVIAAGAKFLSTHPYGVRLFTSMVWARSAIFLSTHPCGVRRGARGC